MDGEKLFENLKRAWKRGDCVSVRKNKVTVQLVFDAEADTAQIQVFFEMKTTTPEQDDALHGLGLVKDSKHREYSIRDYPVDGYPILRELVAMVDKILYDVFDSNDGKELKIEYF
jgi:hypothetical protein